MNKYFILRVFVSVAWIMVFVHQKPSVIPSPPEKVKVRSSKERSSPVVIEKVYPFGEYQGEAQNGLPHGTGEMIYTKRVQIAIRPHGPVCCADAGDYYQGLWYNGDLYYGTLYYKTGEVKEIINVARLPKPYDNQYFIPYNYDCP